MSLTMPPKRKLNLKSTIQYSSTIAHFLRSSSSSSSAPPPTSPSIDLTSSPPQVTTSSASTNQKCGKLGKTLYIWDHGTECFVVGKSRWQCGYCSCTCIGTATTAQ